MTPALRFEVIHERNYTWSIKVSFFVMPSYRHRSGPDNRDFPYGDYNSNCHVAINPDYPDPSTEPCFKGIKQKKTPPCSFQYLVSHEAL
jgi:hypothetical protein